MNKLQGEEVVLIKSVFIWDGMETTSLWGVNDNMLNLRITLWLNSHANLD